MSNIMKWFLVQLNRMLRYALLVLAGAIFWISVISITTLSIPVYIYRWIIIKILAPFFRTNICKTVSVFGQIHATEFTKLRKGHNIPSRLAIILNLVVEGTLSLEKVIQLIESKWIQASCEDGTRKYPEFQQYIDSWMGFMFFKKVQNFQLKDHIYLHKLDENASEDEAELFLRNLTEELQNKPFPHKKSPWEVHLIQNYKNSESASEPGKLSTVFIFRAHHAMGDGFAFFYIVVEELLGHSIDKLGVATGKPPGTKLTQRISFQQILGIITFPIKFLSESGFWVMALVRKKTPWHVPDRKKSGKQIVGRSRLIPVEKIKYIKDQLGVSFTSVLVACTTGASAEMMARSMSRPPSKMVCCSAVPVHRNRSAWRNHSLGVLLDVPCKPADMDIVSRLKECQSEVQFAQQSVQVLNERIVLPLFSLQLAVVAKYLLRPRNFCIVISNFPGPCVPIDFDGMKVLATEVGAGGLVGQTGAMFTTLSYNGKIRISATAENAVMDREEMDELMENICLMIDELYLIANNENEYVKICMAAE